MKPKVRRRLLRAAIILPSLLGTVALLTTLERRRVGATATVPAAAADEARFDGRTLLADVERLASPEFEGRRTGTPGNKAVQDFLVQRLRGMKAEPLFNEYRQPFSFTRHSIRGLLSPSGQYRTDYPEAANIGAVIRGTARPERFIALTAHYDHFGWRDGRLFAGADDNASGLATLLAVGRVLADASLQHSVLLLAFDAEELGIRGAKHFIRHPPVDLGRIDVIVNLDMVGRSDENLLVAAGAAHYPWIEAPVRAAAAKRTIRVAFGHDRPFFPAGMVDDWTHSSDHGPFHDTGIPFVYLGVEDHADYHQPTDTADKISPQFLAEVGSLVLTLMRQLDTAAPAR